MPINPGKQKIFPIISYTKRPKAHASTVIDGYKSKPLTPDGHALADKGETSETVPSLNQLIPTASPTLFHCAPNHLLLKDWPMAVTFGQTFQSLAHVGDVDQALLDHGM